MHPATPARQAFGQPNSRLLWASVIGLSLAMLLLAIFHQQVNPQLAYHRQAVLAGQWWRLISCHFVYLNLDHYLLDGAGFLLITYIFRDLLTARLLWIWLAISAPICGLLLLLDPTLVGYVGLSGILHGWLVIALLLGIREMPFLHTVALLAIAAKLIYEQSPGYDAYYLDSVIAAPVYPNAHLYGALIGLAIGLVCLWLQQRAPR